MEQAETTLRTYQILWPLLLMIVSFLTGLVAYFLKDIRSSLREKQDRQDKQVERVRDELHSFKEKLPSNYVMREDFLRSITALDMKVDTIHRDLGELVKTVSKMLGGGEHREQGK